MPASEIDYEYRFAEHEHDTKTEETPESRKCCVPFSFFEATLLAICSFFLVVAEIFKEEHLAIIEQINRCFRGRANAVVDKGHRLLEQILQCERTGAQG